MTVGAGAFWKGADLERKEAGFSEPMVCTPQLDGEDAGEWALSNMGVIKRVHFAGSMRYDTPVRPDDGRFDVNVAAGMDRLEFVKAVAAISRGRFLGLPKCVHWRAERVRVVPAAPTALELDGEVHEVAEVTLRVVPRVLTVCG